MLRGHAFAFVSGERYPGTQPKDYQREERTDNSEEFPRASEFPPNHNQSTVLESHEGLPLPNVPPLFRTRHDERVGKVLRSERSHEPRQEYRHQRGDKQRPVLQDRPSCPDRDHLRYHVGQSPQTEHPDSEEKPTVHIRPESYDHHRQPYPVDVFAGQQQCPEQHGRHHERRQVGPRIDVASPGHDNPTGDQYCYSPGELALPHRQCHEKSDPPHHHRLENQQTYLAPGLLAPGEGAPALVEEVAQQMRTPVLVEPLVPGGHEGPIIFLSELSLEYVAPGGQPYVQVPDGPGDRPGGGDRR